MPRSSSVKANNWKAHLEPLNKALAMCFEREIAPYVKKALYARLYDNKNADGTPRPQSSFVSQKAIRKSKSSTIAAHAGAGKKSPDTIKAYNRAGQGWNTETYLVRTGAATTLYHKIQRNGRELIVYPKGKTVLSYHIPMSQWRGQIRWFELSDTDKEQIMIRLSRAARTALK